MKGRTLSNQKAGVKKMQVGGKTPYVPLSQRTDPESRARALAMSRAMADKARAPGSAQQAAVNAARSRLDAARASRNAPPTPPMAGPVPPMPPGGRPSVGDMMNRGARGLIPNAGMDQLQMVRKGGMTKKRMGGKC
jgi:hypothetical protein